MYFDSFLFCSCLPLLHASDVFNLPVQPPSPAPINSARASAPSIRRPRRTHRPARPPEPPPPAVWALPPPHPAPQSPLFLALPGAQDLGFHGARNGRGEGASVPILDNGAGGPSRPGRSSATPRCGRPYERWTRRTRPGSALDLQKKKTAFGGSMKWEFLESRETKKKRGCARKPRGLIQDLKHFPI